MAVSNLHMRDAERGRSRSDYWPLISLVVVSALAAFAIAAGSGQVTMTSVMHAYMGVFLVFFALLKIFDLEGFMNGFAMYDLIAKRNSTWGLRLSLHRARARSCLSCIPLAYGHVHCDHNSVHIRGRRCRSRAASRSRHCMSMHGERAFGPAFHRDTDRRCADGCDGNNASDG